MKKAAKALVLFGLVGVFIYACWVALSKLRNNRRVTISSIRTESQTFEHPEVYVCPGMPIFELKQETFQDTLNDDSIQWTALSLNGFL
jgi:hypothetical protein